MISGRQLESIALCPNCDEAMTNFLPRESGFLMLSCRNEKCGWIHVDFLVEKSTMACLWQSSPAGIDNNPIRPADWVNRAGEYVVRGVKPVPKYIREFTDENNHPIQSVKKSISEMIGDVTTKKDDRRVPKFDVNDPAGIKAAVPGQNQDTTSPVLPEPLEKMAWDFFYRATGSELEINTIKSGLYEAYLAGAQSERAKTQDPVCNCVWSNDPYKAPEQHSHLCPVYQNMTAKMNKV